MHSSNAVNENVPIMNLGMVLVDVTHPSCNAVIAFVNVKIFITKLMEIRIIGQVLFELINSGLLQRVRPNGVVLSNR